MGKTEKNETPAKTVAASEPAPGESSVVASRQAGHKHGAKWLIVLAALLVLVILAGTYAYFASHHSAPKHVNPPKTAYDKADEAALSGKSSQAQTILDAQLKTATTPTQKGAIYEQKASIAITTNDYASGLKFAQQAETLYPTRNSAYLIAESAELSGDKTTAIKYYQIVITRTDPHIDDYTIPQLQNKIKQLQG